MRYYKVEPLTFRREHKQILANEDGRDMVKHPAECEAAIHHHADRQAA